MKKIILSILLGMGLCLSAQAATYYWNFGSTTWTNGGAVYWSDNAVSGGTTGVAPLSTDSVVFNQSSTNGTETLQLTNAYTFAGITFRNTGTTTLYSSSTNAQTITVGSGGITIDAGSGLVNMGNGSNRGTSLALGASQTWNNNSSSLFYQKKWTSSTPTSLSLGANTLTLDGTGTGGWQFDAPVTGTGELIKNGTNSTLTMNGTNTYSGGTTINGGSITVGSVSALGTGMVTNKTTSGTVLFLTTNTTIEGFVSSGGTSTAGTIAGVDTNSRTLTVGAGGLVQNADAGGFLDIGNDSNRGTSLKLGASQTWSNNASGTSKAIRLRTGASSTSYSTLDLGTNQLTLAGVGNFGMSSQIIGTGGINQNSSGTTTLGGTNTYSGGTTVSAGKLTLNVGSTLGADTGALTASGGTLNLGGNTLTNGTVTISGGTISNGTLTASSYAGQSGTVDAILAGSSALTKTTTGTLTLSGANTYTGATTVAAGKLIVNGSLASATTVNAGGTLGGTGTLQAVTMNAGSILSAGNSPGTMNFNGALLLSAGSTNIMEVWSATLYDVINGSGLNTATLSGDLIIDFAGWTGAAATNGTTFMLFKNWGSIVPGATYTFLNLDKAGLTEPQLLPTGGSGELGFTVTAIPEPATFLLFGVGGMGAWLIRRNRLKVSDDDDDEVDG